MFISGSTRHVGEIDQRTLCTVTMSVCMRHTPQPRALLLPEHDYIIQAPLKHYYVIEDFHEHVYTVKRHYYIIQAIF